MVIASDVKNVQIGEIVEVREEGLIGGNDKGQYG